MGQLVPSPHVSVSFTACSRRLFISSVFRLLSLTVCPAYLCPVHRHSLHCCRWSAGVCLTHLWCSSVVAKHPITCLAFASRYAVLRGLQECMGMLAQTGGRLLLPV